MAKNNSKEHTRERIINSAKTLFAEQGYQKTTIVDISKRAGLSEAALYDYFQGKEDLLLTIPDLWVSELVRDLEEQLFGVKGAVNKLRKYLWWYMRRVEQSPLDAKIVYLFLKTNANFLNTEVYSNVKNFYSYLVEIFEEGRKSGEMKADLNPRAARDIFVGTMDHIISRWLLKDMSYSLFDELENIFDLMVDAFKAKHSN
ncbi:MAG: TetR/AcrR family transcriptional regulator [Desulfobacterales bacterium]|nr:MAG: TetR/AcrR family transcriptional regulator [Desulfobacterales bacterium]